MTKTTSGTRDTVRTARARASRRPFYIALAALLLAGVAVVIYAWQRGRNAAAPILIDRNATIAGEAVGYVRGSPDAPVEIIEFADFECPGCGEFARFVEPDVRTRLIETGMARFRFLDLQVNPSHRNSPFASVAAACANDQGRFWEMHDLIFAGQGEWSTQATNNPKPVFQGYAQRIGLEPKAWEACYDASRHAERIVANYQEARRVGLQYTPSFLIGRRMLAGGQGFDAIKAAVDSATAEAKAAGSAPKAPTP